MVVLNQDLHPQGRLWTPDGNGHFALNGMADNVWRYMPHTFAHHMSQGQWVPYKYLIMLSHIIANAVSMGFGRIIVTIPPRHGKQIADSTPVLTTDGWKTHGELQVGDYVFGSDGNPVEVLGISEKTIADCIVKFSDGSEILCHENHEWVVHDRSRHRERTMETNEFFGISLSCEGQRGIRGHRNRFQIDGNVICQFTEKKQEIHPYMLGVWLGDGSSTGPTICGAVSDSAIIEKLADIGYIASSAWTHKTTGVKYYYYSNIVGTMRQYGLYNNKHIPHDYMFGSVEQRLELLAGIVDTDGHKDRRNRYRVSTVSEVLARQIHELVTSLGGNAYIMRAEPIMSSSGIQGKRVVYQVGFNLSHYLPVALQRKKHDGASFVYRKRAITDVCRTVNSEPGHCIQVEGGIYLVGKSLIPTHNSEFISRWVPAWFLSEWPHKRVVLSTYEATFAESWGRKVRDFLLQNENALGPIVSRTSKRASFWDTIYGGAMMTAGVKGPINGKGLDLGIVDDPFKNWKEAQSVTQRKDVWEWFNSVLYTRCEPPGGVLIVLHTRWHDDDMIGMLLNSHNDRWTVVNFPAICEDPAGDILGREIGEPLCPQRFDSYALRRIKAALPGQMWDALYQQRPAMKEGNIFMRDEWKYYIPGKQGEPIMRIQSWDTAQTPHLGSAYSVGQTWDLTENGLFLVDQVRRRMAYPELRNHVGNYYQEYNPTVVLVEDKSTGTSIIQEYAHTTIPIIPVTPEADKVLRGMSVAPLVTAGKVFLPSKVICPWVEGYVDRAAKFPNTTYVDEIDAMSQALSYLKQYMVVGIGRISSGMRRVAPQLIQAFKYGAHRH